MQINKADKTNCDNLIRLLKRAKVELEGAEEILGTAEVLKWTATLAARLDKELKDQEEKAKVAAAAMTAKPVESLAAPKAEKKAKVK